MNIKLDINLDSPELFEYIRRLVQGLHSPECREEEGQGDWRAQRPATTSSRGAITSLGDASAVSRDASTISSHETAVSTVTYEDVRARLAALFQEGKQAEVKALIAGFGASKLRDVPEEKFGELLEKAEGI